jgi:hypothetical protein
MLEKLGSVIMHLRQYRKENSVGECYSRLEKLGSVTLHLRHHRKGNSVSKWYVRRQIDTL